jgi:hypothetical protein
VLLLFIQHRIAFDAISGLSKALVDTQAASDELTTKQLQAFHGLFGKPFDTLSPSEQRSKLAAKASLDLQLMSPHDVIAILVDLIMYKCQPLANKAFGLLVRFYSQRKAFLDMLTNVRLLSDAAEVELFDEVPTLFSTCSCPV